MILHGLRERAEDDAHLGELVFKGGRDGDRVEDRIDGNIREPLLLVDRNAEFRIGLQQLGIDLVEAVERGLLLGRGVVDDVLVVDGIELDVGPLGLALLARHLEPILQGFQAPLQHELGLAFARRDQAHDVFIEPLGHAIFVDLGDKAPFVILGCQIANGIDS